MNNQETCPYCRSAFVAIFSTNLLSYNTYGCGVFGAVGHQYRPPLCKALERANKAEAELAEENQESGKYWSRDKIAKKEGDELKTENIKLRELLDRAMSYRRHRMGCYANNYDYCECGSDSVQEDYDELKQPRDGCAIDAIAQIVREDEKRKLAEITRQRDEAIAIAEEALSGGHREPCYAEESNLAIRCRCGWREEDEQLDKLKQEIE